MNGRSQSIMNLNFDLLECEKEGTLFLMWRLICDIVSVCIPVFLLQIILGS